MSSLVESLSHQQFNANTRESTWIRRCAAYAFTEWNLRNFWRNFSPSLPVRGSISIPTIGTVAACCFISFFQQLKQAPHGSNCLTGTLSNVWNIWAHCLRSLKTNWSAWLVFQVLHLLLPAGRLLKKMCTSAGHVCCEMKNWIRMQCIGDVQPFVVLTNLFALRSCFIEDLLKNNRFMSTLMPEISLSGLQYCTFKLFLTLTSSIKLLNMLQHWRHWF